MKLGKNGKLVFAFFGTQGLDKGIEGYENAIDILLGKSNPQNIDTPKCTEIESILFNFIVFLKINNVTNVVVEGGLDDKIYGLQFLSDIIEKMMIVKKFRIGIRNLCDFYLESTMRKQTREVKNFRNVAKIVKRCLNNARECKDENEVISEIIAIIRQRVLAISQPKKKTESLSEDAKFVFSFMVLGLIHPCNEGVTIALQLINRDPDGIRINIGDVGTSTDGFYQIGQMILSLRKNTEVPIEKSLQEILEIFICKEIWRKGLIEIMPEIIRAMELKDQVRAETLEAICDDLPELATRLRIQKHLTTDDVLLDRLADELRQFKLLSE